MTGDYIGYFGIGFKSIFLISEHIEIYSGDYRFEFDKKKSNDDQIPWQVIPLWIEQPTIGLHPDPEYTTIFNIYVEEPKLLEELREEIKPFQANIDRLLHNRLLLFLHDLECIEITDIRSNTIRKILKLPSPSSETNGYKTYTLQEYTNDKLVYQESWLVFRSEPKVTDEVKQDDATKRWKKDKIDKREVVVAFRLNEERNLTKEEKGTAYFGVHSYMPLKDVESGLNFLIQADFLTTSNRSALAPRCAWNEWLAEEIYKLIIEKCVPTFIRDDRWKKNFTKILYSPWGGHELFENNIKKQLRKYLETMPCLIGKDGSLLKADESLMVSAYIKEFISDDDLKALYPDKKVLAPDCEIAPDIERVVKKGPTYSPNSGTDNIEMQRLIKLKAEQKDITFFKKFYYILSTYAESNLRDNFKYRDILLTDTWDLVDSRTVYLKPHNLSIPIEVKENFKVIHSDLSADTTILHFLKILGVKELTAEDTQNILKTKEIPNMGKTWEGLSKEEKIRKTKICKDLCDKHQIDVKNLGFLTLISKSGEWLKPADLVFSKEYRPDHRIEEFLTEKELLKSEDLLRLNIKFLSHEYITGDDKDIKSWHDFFKELGLDRNLYKEKVVQRVGINSALCFEKGKQRVPRELPRSEESGGYDIESNSGERLIEVKGRSDPSPQIWLTPAQHKKLQKEGEKYFLYVVRDALKNPILSEIKGSKLLDVDYSIGIDFYKWKNLSEEEFQP